jgi:lipopolysaccharide export LptBFGC system permease protein LptF
VRILSHYFVARFCGLFLSVLLVALAILATIELVLNLEDLTAGADAGAALSGLHAIPGVLTALWNRLATTYLVDLLPVSSFIASFLTFALAGRRLEWVAIGASGIPPMRVVLPVLGAALGLSIVAAGLHETLVLDAAHARRVDEEDDRDEIDLERRAFWYHRGPIITNIGYADPATRTLHDVELFERGLGDDSGRIVRIVRAPDVQILADGTWRFERASVWRFDPANPLAEPRFEGAVGLELDLESLPRNALTGADPAILPLRALARHLESEPDPASATHRRLAEVLHERLSRPFWVLVLCWLALPFARVVDHRGHVATAAVTALVALTLFFLMAEAGQTLTHLRLLPVGLAAWTTPLLTVGLGALLLTRRPD